MKDDPERCNTNPFAARLAKSAYYNNDFFLKKLLFGICTPIGAVVYLLRASAATYIFNVFSNYIQPYNSSSKFLILMQNPESDILDSFYVREGTKIRTLSLIKNFAVKMYVLKWTIFCGTYRKRQKCSPLVQPT
jgi:hypothetical protein